jgi:hypothetical protein
MQPLSEKAKGKQRADPVPDDVFNNVVPIPPRQLMVRFTEGVQDLVLQVAENDSVRDVKAKVCPYLACLCSLPYRLLPTCIPFFSSTPSDSRRAPQTPASSLTPHPRWTAPQRRDANLILAWFA